MKKKIYYRAEDSGSNPCLAINVHGIKTKDELIDLFAEIEELGFSIWAIDEGTLYATKPADGPGDILDPVYDSFRYLARPCEDD